MLTLTINALREHNACNLDARVDDLRRVLPDVTDDQPVPLRVWWDLPSTTLSDRFWSLRAVEPELTGRILGVRAACLAARRVLHLTRGQGRPVCETAIVAAEAWANNPCEETRRAAAADAYATYAAAYAAAYATANAYANAYAAAAAACGAYAAYAAAATYAAYAAKAADAAAYAAERDLQRADLDRLLGEL